MVSGLNLEFLLVALISVMVWAIPLVIAIWLVFTLAGIRRDVRAIREQLERRS